MSMLTWMFFQRQVINTNATVPQALKPDRQMQIARFYRHAWLLITNVRQGEIAPAAGDLANIQSWYPAMPPL